MTVHFHKFDITWGSPDHRWLEHIFEAADRNGDDTLDCKEVIKMAKELNMGFTKKDIQNMFEVHCVNAYYGDCWG